MTWKINGELIVDDCNMVRGSIVETPSAFNVEILWSRGSGDITHKAGTRGEAEAFIAGVEKALVAVASMQAGDGFAVALGRWTADREFDKTRGKK